jgi:NAD+ diphosphatase
MPMEPLPYDPREADHRSRSRLNGLCSYVIDRVTHLRTDAGWIESRLADERTRVLPVWRSRNLVQAGDLAHAVMFAPGEAADLIEGTDALVLLGEDEGVAYFAAAVSPRDDALHARLSSLGEFLDLRDTAPLLAARETALLAHARAMMHWHQTHRHCGSCGAPTRVVEAGHSRVCTREACGRSVYPRTDPAIIVAVSRGERLLLGRKPDWPAGRFSTVAGFVEPGETLEEAVAREVKEETGVICDAVHYHSSQPWPFPRSIMLGFHATAASDDIVVDRNELDDARWFTREVIAAGLADGSFLLPRPLSVSFRLIEDWFDADRPDGMPSLRSLAAGHTW